MASICDRSFDLISILGRFVSGSNSYIGIKIVFFRYRFFNVDLGQTTQNDRNDHGMISGFLWEHRFDSVFIDEISISQANLDFNFHL